MGNRMKWQYKWIVLPAFAADRENMLSEMGLNGWELVGFDQGLAYFKRPKPEVELKTVDATRFVAVPLESRTVGSKKK
jgi:hypothetical protein